MVDASRCDGGNTWSDMEDVAVGTGITSATQNYFDTAFGEVL